MNSPKSHNSSGFLVAAAHQHHFRNGPDIVKKLRAQLDANGYQDVGINLIGDVPWSRGSNNPRNDISVAHSTTMAEFGLSPLDGMAAFMGISRKEAPANSSSGQPATSQPAPKAPGSGGLASLQPDVPEVFGRNIAGGYWPSYLFTDGEVGEKVGTVTMPMPASFGGLQAGGRAHAANEYLVIEGKGRTPGMASAEKYVVATVINFANTTTTTPRPKSTATK